MRIRKICWSRRPTKARATGIFVNFMYDKTSNKEDNIIWKTDDYQYQQDFGGSADGN